MLGAELRVVDREGSAWAIRAGKGQQLLTTARTQQEAIELAKQQLSESSGGTLEVYTGTGGLKTRITVEPLTIPPAGRFRFLTLLKKPFVWGGGIALGVLATALTGVMTPWVEDLGDRMTRSGDPVIVNHLKIDQEGGMFSVALPAEVKVSDEEAFLAKREGAWFESRGAVRVGHQMIKLTVSGNRRDAVRITDIVAVKDCQAPLDGTYFYAATAGGSPSIVGVMNMDDPLPRVLSEPASDANGATKDPTPYFDANTVTLEDGEQQVFNITVYVKEQYCTFDLELSVLEGDSETFQRIDDNGKPFAITPEMERDDWQRVYQTGIGCSGEGLRGWAAVAESWYDGGDGEVC